MGVPPPGVDSTAMIKALVIVGLYESSHIPLQTCIILVVLIECVNTPIDYESPCWNCYLLIASFLY